MRFNRTFVTGAWLAMAIGTPALFPLSPAAAQDAAQAPAGAGVKINVDGAPSRGPVDAPITIVEFSDFECPFSAQSARNIRRLLELYPTQVRWVSKQYPLKFHKKAPLAHEAALAAGEQGRFFEMYQLIYQNHPRLERDDLDGYARELGLDMARFAEALDDRNLRSRVVSDILEARRLGVFATPTLFVNGHRIMGAKVLPELRAVVESLLRADGGAATGK